MCVTIYIYTHVYIYSNYLSICNYVYTYTCTCPYNCMYAHTYTYVFWLHNAEAEQTQHASLFQRVLSTYMRATYPNHIIFVPAIETLLSTI